MRHVSLSTGFWTEDIEGWSADARLLYLWTWTNDHAHGLTAIYACSEASILAETGLSKKRFLNAKVCIGDKVRWYPGGWLWVVARAGHALSGNQPKYVRGVESYLKTVPPAIQADFWKKYEIDFKNKENPIFRSKSMASKGIPEKQEDPTESESESESEFDIKAKVAANAAPLPDLFSTWNEVAKKNGLPTVTVWDLNRKRALASRWREPWWRENWQMALEKIGESQFLQGKNDRGWRASIDWFLKPDSVARIIECKYSGKVVSGPVYESLDGRKLKVR